MHRIARFMAAFLVTPALMLLWPPAPVTAWQAPPAQVPVWPAPPALSSPCDRQPQRAEIPYRFEERRIQSGQHTAALGEQSQVVFSTTVRSAEAPWMQVLFGAADLGRGSRLRLTGLQDGATQELNASLLRVWNQRSAMFAGDAIQIELVAAPDDPGVFFEVASVIVGEWVDGVRPPPTPEGGPEANLATPMPAPEATPPTPESVCGVDDRTAANDPAVGRIVPTGCTGFVISNGAFLTAGHCFDINMQQIQFNVPPSLGNGTIQPPHPNDQYPIDRSNVTWRDNGAGDDWAVFRVVANMTRTVTPPLAYGSFYRVFLNEPFSVRVTGYGVDGPAPCYGDDGQPGCDVVPPAAVPLTNTSQTLQTHVGPSLGRTGDHYEHQTDTQPGNSGSPVRNVDFWQVVAIHTHGSTSADCTSNPNGGTAFTNAALVNAINAFPGPNARYVDAALPTLSEDGTVIRPFNEVNEGLSAVPNWGIVSIVQGQYNENLTINQNVTLQAPVGAVVIGAP